MPEKKRDMRVAALGRFATAITVFNVLGHTWLGFEQAWAHPIVALATAYAVELLLELTEARFEGRPVRFGGGLRELAVFLLPAHITGLAVAMLLYSNETVAPVAFAVGVAIVSKYVLRVAAGGRRRHYFNPSNLGITVTLLLFPWVGIAMPYQFTENLYTWGNWVLPAIMICAGSFLNARFTKRMPLILTWLSVFALQGVLRSAVSGAPIMASLMPMTGVAFILFTFYMVTDPSTTPRSRRGQMLFGAGVALAYGLLMTQHVVFTMFFALSIASAVRGAGIWLGSLSSERRAVARGAREPVPALATVPVEPTLLLRRDGSDPAPAE